MPAFPFFSITFALLCGHTASVTAQFALPGLLASEVPQLSTFFELLNSTPALYNRVAQGGATVLAPSNDAWTALNASGYQVLAADGYDSLLSYHVLQGFQSGSALDSSTAVFQTLLSDAALTNVTGGQCVIAVGANGTGNIVSGLWESSAITTQNILFTNGNIQVLDKVLTIPPPVLGTISEVNLTYFITFASDVLAGTNSTVLGDYYSTGPDVTLLAPESPEYLSSNYTGFQNLTLQQKLDVYHYHTINGSVLYSPDLTNGSSFRTVQGGNVTVYVVNGSIYLNDAKITNPDLLTANGVIQVLDKPLNPNNTHAKPAALLASPAATSSAASHSSGGLRPGDHAGLGVGVAIAALLIISLVAWTVVRRQRRRKASALDRDKPLMERHELATKANTGELAANHELKEMADDTHIRELHGEAPVRELDGRERAYELQS